MMNNSTSSSSSGGVAVGSTVTGDDNQQAIDLSIDNPLSAFGYKFHISKSSEIVANEGSSSCCTICLAPFETDATMIVPTTPCGHNFHSPCLYQLLEEHSSCPVCKGQIK